MAKKGSQKTGQDVGNQPAQAPITTTTPLAAPKGGNNNKWSFFDYRTQAVILSIIAFVFYFNSFFNEYAHDDGIVIVKNEYVQEGLSGIDDILTKDAYDSYYRQLNTVNQLNGGRYRPLSIVTFAIEQEFMGSVSEEKVDSVIRTNNAYGVRGPQEQKLIQNMQIRHVINVLWYIGSILILLYFLRKIVFPSDLLMAFVAALIFTIHPIHTEVVANVKSRDEIMSLLFICLTLIYAFRYQEQNKVKMLVYSLIFYFLAFLSKEYAITLVVLLPLSLYLFKGVTVPKSILAFLPYLGVIAIYWYIRQGVGVTASINSDEEVLNNPYLFAEGMEKIATEIATTLNYLKLLILPHPLSADYSYNSIPYKDFSHPLVWLSIIVHVGMVATMFVFLLKIKPTSSSNMPQKEGEKGISQQTMRIMVFAIAFYLLHLALVCNIFFEIGATMGERLIYHSSVGFAIAVAYLLCKGVAKLKTGENGYKALAGILSVLVLAAGAKTIARNADWKNDGTLFAADINTVPNSVLVCGNVAASLITKADYAKNDQEREKYLYDAIEILNRTLNLHRTFVAGYLNRGIAWYKLGNMENAKPNIDTVRSLYPTYPTLPGMYKLIGEYHMKKGWGLYGKNGRYPEAIQEFKKGIAVDSTNPELWYNLGGAFYSNRQFQDAINCWQRAIRLRPNYTQAQQGMQAAMMELNGTTPAAMQQQGKQ